MKIKTGYVMNKVAGKNVVLYMGKDKDALKGMIQMNDVGAFIWGVLEKECTLEDVRAAVLKEYDVDEETAYDNIDRMLEILRMENILDE